MKKIFSVALIGATLLYAESSAFGAGDLTSNSPYGLTSSEKLLKEKLDTLSNNNVKQILELMRLNKELKDCKVL